MPSRGRRARIALVFALFLSSSFMSAAANAGEYHDQSSMSGANQQQALLFLLTMLTVAKSTIAHADQFVAGYTGTNGPERVLYADAQESKDWVHGAD